MFRRDTVSRSIVQIIIRRVGVEVSDLKWLQHCDNPVMDRRQDRTDGLATSVTLLVRWQSRMNAVKVQLNDTMMNFKVDTRGVEGAVPTVLKNRSWSGDGNEFSLGSIQLKSLSNNKANNEDEEDKAFCLSKGLVYEARPMYSYSCFQAEGIEAPRRTIPRRLRRKSTLFLLWLASIGPWQLLTQPSRAENKKKKIRDENESYESKEERERRD